MCGIRLYPPENVKSCISKTPQNASESMKGCLYDDVVLRFFRNSFPRNDGL